MEEKIEKVKQLLLSTNRKGMAELIVFMDERGFFTSAASTKFHGNYKGGLLDHSINIYNTYVKLCKEYELDVPRDSKIIVAFLHDLCKAGLYTGESAPFAYNNFVGQNGHGVYSVERVIRFIELTDLERDMIKFHMGIYTKDSPLAEVIDAFKDTRIKMFYFADEIAAQCVDVKVD